MIRQKSRALLLALSLSTVSLLTFSISASAKAPEIYFYPARAWAVSAGPMETASASVHNCSINSEFNNGYIVEFDGSHKWVQSMSIDFRQDAFKTGETYNVSFSVPGQINQDLPAIAVDGHLLHFNMQNQKAAYEAMRDSSVVDMVIDGNAFRFYMTGFSTAAIEFERCMAGDPAQTVQTNAAGGLQASKSEDPYVNVTVNESIALEEAERSGASATIPPEKPTAETDMAVVQDVINTMPPKVSASEKAVEATVRTMKDNFSPPAHDTGAPHKRMSELLAEEIAKNPGIADDEVEQNTDKNEESPARLNSAEPEISPEAALAQKAMEAESAKKKIELEQAIAWTPPPAEDIQIDVVEKAPAETTEIIVAETIPAEEEDSLFARIKRLAVRTPAEKPAQVKTETPAAKAMEIEMAAAETQKSAPQKELLPVIDVKPAIATPVPPRAEIKINRESSYIQADFTDQFANIEPASGATDFDSGTDPEIYRKISQLEHMVSTLKAENAALNADIQAAIKEAEHERLSISSDNWNLESATMRFNESERQVKRIGQQLQRERTQCDMEKKELEAMLFDPQVTSQQQMARLSELERALEDAQHQLKTGGVQ